jgi:DNA-binding response OmpR family regulator
MTHSHGSHACQCNAAVDKKVVLLVDDDPDYLFQQKAHLEAAGFEVITAEGEKSAEKLLASRVPDVAVLDLMMENADGGFMLSYHIRKQHPQVPIVLVSAVNSETGLDFDARSDEQRKWIKADAFLAKPIRFEELKREIDRLLAR